ncbi:MAG: type II secretion system F family protein [Candidatus Altiarchaeota archaeon]|nr:type II secretion system F family protein [Candidatus Altiarchaeota archaeon]
MEKGLRTLNTPRKEKKDPMKIPADIFYAVMGTIMKVFSYTLVSLGNLFVSVFHLIHETFKGLIGPFVEFFIKFVRSVHHRLGSLFPFHTRGKLEEMFLYSGLTRNPEETLGITVMYSILFPIAVGLITFIFTEDDIMLSGGAALTSFILVWIILYMMLNLLVDKRTSNIEKVLPDLLSMIAQNMSAGMTPYNALWVAARPEFGALADEMQKVARDTLTGTPLETALINMSNRVNSDKLQRTVKLMIQGMRSGGELPTVLQEISRDIRTEQNIVKRMESETTAQVMFILFSLILGAPLLFAASSQFISIFTKTFSYIDVEALSEQAQGGMVSIQPLAISEGEFVLYALIVLGVCCFFGSLLIGIMRSGKMTRGISLIPITLLLSIGVFLLLRFILSSFFAGMMGTPA